MEMLTSDDASLSQAVCLCNDRNMFDGEVGKPTELMNVLRVR